MMQSLLSRIFVNVKNLTSCDHLQKNPYLGYV